MRDRGADPKGDLSTGLHGGGVDRKVRQYTKVSVKADRITFDREWYGAWWYGQGHVYVSLGEGKERGREGTVGILVSSSQ